MESFECIPSVLNVFSVWWGALGPGDPQNGGWVMVLWVVLKVVEGHGVLVDIDEGMWR